MRDKARGTGITTWMHETLVGKRGQCRESTAGSDWVHSGWAMRGKYGEIGNWIEGTWIGEKWGGYRKSSATLN